MAGNSTEVAYNFALAKLLRLEGLNAQAEQRKKFGSARGQADVLIDFDDYAVVIEAEFGSPGKKDADKRFPREAPAVVNGLEVRLVVALGYPAHLAQLPESDSESNLSERSDLRIAYRYYGEDWGEESSTSVAALAATLRDYWVQSDNGIGIEEIVEQASEAIRLAASVLEKVDADGEENADGPSTKALIWLNALLFQELLARHFDHSELPAEHADKKIRRPDPERGAEHLLSQWIELLEINWWPIFHIAKETLKTTPAPNNYQALAILKRAAAEIAETGAIRRHDVAGRIFHRLLDSRKFLATNYTTIPAAIMLAGLAFDERSESWRGIDFSSPASVKALKVVDPACGSGTLLMAATQEILKRARRTDDASFDERVVVRAVLEEALYGFDVVPAAVHLAASTLCMAEARQLIQDMQLWRLRHEVVEGLPRLGSLDFLATSPSKGFAKPLGLFEEEGVSTRVSGSAEQREQMDMPGKCHLVIANPPYTRAGGPGNEDNSNWNPIFGSLLDGKDADTMKRALEKALSPTAASMYAGLGSAFVELANQHLDHQGRLAFVLPGTLLSGTRWASVRRLLLGNYCIDWVVVSHDGRNRSARKELPGRRWIAFSESTRIAETLVVATKNAGDARQHHQVRFVNLLRNPDEPLEALALTQRLLALDEEGVPSEPVSIRIGERNWGSVVAVPQTELDQGPWSYASLVQPELSSTRLRRSSSSTHFLDNIPRVELQNLADFGPYEMQIKNPDQGLFTIIQSTETLHAGIPALWHHKSTYNNTLLAASDARLQRRSDKDSKKQEAMLAKQRRLHLARELGWAPQKLACVLTETPMLGVRSWVTILLHHGVGGTEEALCLWFNSTPGVLMRVLHGGRPYLGRSTITHELARSLPVLDVGKLDQQRLKASVDIFHSLKNRPLQGFTDIATDPVRRELNSRFAKEILDVDPDLIEALTQKLALEPTMHVRH